MCARDSKQHINVSFGRLLINIAVYKTEKLDCSHNTPAAIFFGAISRRSPHASLRVFRVCMFVCSRAFVREKVDQSKVAATQRQQQQQQQIEFRRLGVVDMRVWCTQLEWITAVCVCGVYRYEISKTSCFLLTTTRVPKNPHPSQSSTHRITSCGRNLIGIRVAAAAAVAGGSCICQ